MNLKCVRTLFLAFIIACFAVSGTAKAQDVTIRNTAIYLILKNEKILVDSIVLQKIIPDWVDKMEVHKFTGKNGKTEARISIWIHKHFREQVRNLIRNTNPPKAPANLRVCDKPFPLGTDDKPYFGWRVYDSDPNEIQTAYQILVSTSAANLEMDIADVWDSGKVNSRSQNYVYFNGIQLQPSARYYWKVRTWDRDDQVSPYSAPARFETGLFSNTGWSGAWWIRSNSEAAEDHSYFRKKASLQAKKVESATLYVSACHSYQFFVNGKFAGKGFNHHYPQYSYYHAWDITSHLEEGREQVFAFHTHWYGGGQGRAAGARGLLVKIVVRYTDSSETVIVSDSTWKHLPASQWSTSQPQRNGEGVGWVEMIDSRKFVQNWNAIEFDDHGWKYATLHGKHPAAPWTGNLRTDLARVTETGITPASVKKVASGKYIIDLGKIYAGNFRILFKGGNAGDTVKMRGGFVLENDSTVSQKLDQNTNMSFGFILNGGEALFEPYVYLGMRYLQIENFHGRVTPVFVSRHYELDPSGSGFLSSHSMLNSVWELMSHSLVVGAQEGFVDTPTREKGAFLGDSWSQSVPAMSTMYDRVLTFRSLNEFLTSQDQYWPDGRLNAVYPNGDGARDIPDYTQMFLLWVWDYYLQTGNLEFLKINYHRFEKIAGYIYRYRNDTTGLIKNPEGGGGPYKYGIIDWPEGMRYGYDMNTHSRTVINVYAYACFMVMAKIAGETGNTNAMADYTRKAEDLKTAINKWLIHPDGVYIDGLKDGNLQSRHVSQHANIFPLAAGIVPEEIREQVIREVKLRRMNVGMVCLRWLPESLGVSGQGEHLADLYTNAGDDGWAQTVKLGGTVTWESWDAHLKNESLSHPWGAAGIIGIQNYFLGIIPVKPQHELIVIKPLDFGEKLHWVSGSYSTDQGIISVRWTRSRKKYSLEVNLPVNIEAKVYLPLNIKSSEIIHNGQKVNCTQEQGFICVETVGSGTHTFDARIR